MSTRPPYVLFTTRITPEVLQKWHDDKKTDPRGTVYVASGLKGFNGTWVNEEAARDPQGLAARFLNEVTKLDVGVYGDLSTFLIDSVVTQLYQGREAEGFTIPKKTYDTWAASKMKKIKDLLKKTSVPHDLQEVWTVFTNNANTLADAFMRTDGLVNQGGISGAMQEFDRVCGDLELTSNDDRCLMEGKFSPFVRRMTRNHPDHLDLTRFLAENKEYGPPDAPLHNIRALTRQAFKFDGSCADLAAVAWLLMNTDLTREEHFGVQGTPFQSRLGHVSASELQKVSGVFEDILRKAFVTDQGFHGLLPITWHEDAEFDDTIAGHVLDSLSKISNRPMKRITYSHPGMQEDDGFHLPGCTGQVIFSTGTNLKEQQKATSAHRHCFGCIYYGCRE